MKRKLLINILLAFVWAAVTGAMTSENLIIGFVFGYIVVALLQPLLGYERYGGRFIYWLRLIPWFIMELVISSVRVARDVLRPTLKPNAGVIGIPLDVESDAEITVLANMISLTPGTLSLEVSEDRKTLYIHDMYIRDQDVERERQAIKDTMERRVRIAFDTYHRTEQLPPEMRPTGHEAS